MAEGEDKMMCKTHTSQELALYCKTCDEVMCRDCYIFSKDHKKHETAFVTEVAPKLAPEYRKEIKEVLGEITEKTDTLDSLAWRTERAQKTLSQAETNYKEIRHKTEQYFETQMALLKERKKKLLAKIDEELPPKIEDIRTKAKEQQKAAEEVAMVVKEGEEMLKNSSNIHLLVKHKKVVKQLQNLKTKSETLEKAKQFILYEDYDITLPDIDSPYLLKPNMTEYMATADASNVKSIPIKTEMTIPLTLKPFDELTHPRGENIRCFLQPVRLGSYPVNKISVKKVSSLKHDIVVVPQQRGFHNITVKIGGRHIRGSRFFFKAVMPVGNLGPVVKQFTCKNPTRLAKARKVVGRVYLLEEGRQGISIFEHQKPSRRTHPSKIVKETFIALNESHLFGIAVHRDILGESWFISTGETNKLLKMTDKGVLVKTVGSLGSKHFEFKTIKGLSVNSHDELYVCDAGNDRVKVFDLDLNLRTMITGTEKKLCCPQDVAFDESDNTYIAEKKRIQVMSRERKFIRTIGEGTLEQAVSLSIMDNSVFVADYGRGCVSVFTTDGTFLQDFGQETLRKPLSISVDDDGFVYVSTAENKLFVF